MFTRRYAKQEAYNHLKVPSGILSFHGIRALHRSWTLLVPPQIRIAAGVGVKYLQANLGEMSCIL
jgi:hypothetical protein